MTDNEYDQSVRITNTFIGREYMWDSLADVDRDMLRHNLRCKQNILENPEKFPRANFDLLEKQVEEHELFLAMYPG